MFYGASKEFSKRSFSVQIGRQIFDGIRSGLEPLRASHRRQDHGLRTRQKLSQS